MQWVVIGIVLVGTIVVIGFIIATDGRYFGKGLVYWVYDRFGPALFASRGEAVRWHDLSAALGLHGDESILDVGTAVGDLPLGLTSLPNSIGRAVGIDWSPRMVARANAEAARRGLSKRVHFEVVDVRNGLPFPDEAFDLVICMGLLETLPGPEKVLCELARVVSPRGMLVVSVYKGSGAVAATLSQEWYAARLPALGLGNPRIAALRRTQDILITERLAQSA